MPYLVAPGQAAAGAVLARWPVRRLRVRRVRHVGNLRAAVSQRGGREMDGVERRRRGAALEPRRQGAVLFAGQTLMAVPVSLQPTFSSGTRRGALRRAGSGRLHRTTATAGRWRPTADASSCSRRRTGPGAAARRRRELAGAAEKVGAGLRRRRDRARGLQLKVNNANTRVTDDPPRSDGCLAER